jgi:hypothetical protein
MNKECLTPICPECIKEHSQMHIRKNYQIDFETIENAYFISRN